MWEPNKQILQFVCLEARRAADSKTSLIMSHSERFKSLLKGFTALKMHLIFCMLLDTINYTHFALHIVSNNKVMDSLEDTWGAGRNRPQLPSVHFRASPCPTTCPLTIPISSGATGSHLFPSLVSSCCCCWHICTSTAVWRPQDFREGSSRWWPCWCHCSGQKEGPKYHLRGDFPSS